MKDSYVDDALAKVSELGTVGAMKWLEAKMEEYAEQRVREVLAKFSPWLHAAYDRPPQSPECLEMLVEIDSLVKKP